MKKLFAVVIACVMVLCFSACGLTNEDVRGDVKRGDNKSTPTEDTENITEALEEEKEFSIGESSGSEYKNKYINLKYDFADEWHLLDNDEIKEMNNLALDIMGDELADKMKDADYFYDMVAQKNDQSASINIIFQKMNTITTVTADADKIVENSLPDIEKVFTNSGYTDVDAHKVDITVAGKSYKGISCIATSGENAIYQKQALILKGSYAVFITVTSSVNDMTDQIFDGFVECK